MLCLEMNMQPNTHNFSCLDKLMDSRSNSTSTRSRHFPCCLSRVHKRLVKLDSSSTSSNYLPNRIQTSNIPLDSTIEKLYFDSKYILETRMILALS